MADFKFKEDECPHNSVIRDMVFGQDSGDKKCLDCGKTEWGSKWIEEDRKKLAEKKSKPET